MFLLLLFFIVSNDRKENFLILTTIPLLCFIFLGKKIKVLDYRREIRGNYIREFPDKISSGKDHDMYTKEFRNKI